MKTFEFFCGTKSFTKVAQKLGYDTLTQDIESKYDPDFCCNILDFDISNIPKDIDVLWFSPPCKEYSVMKIGWRDFKKADELVQKCFDIIRIVKPRYWFIENPANYRLPSRPVMKYLNNDIFKTSFVVNYCMYGFPVHKKTRIWTNFYDWIPRDLCISGVNRCGFTFEKDFYSGHIGKNEFNFGSYEDRVKIPPALFFEIFEQIWRKKQ